MAFNNNNSETSRENMNCMDTHNNDNTRKKNIYIHIHLLYMYLPNLLPKTILISHKFNSYRTNLYHTNSNLITFKFSLSMMYESYQIPYHIFDVQSDWHSIENVENLYVILHNSTTFIQIFNFTHVSIFLH